METNKIGDRTFVKDSLSYQHYLEAMDIVENSTEDFKIVKKESDKKYWKGNKPSYYWICIGPDGKEKLTINNFLHF